MGLQGGLSTQRLPCAWLQWLGGRLGDCEFTAAAVHDTPRRPVVGPSLTPSLFLAFRKVQLWCGAYIRRTPWAGGVRDDQQMTSTPCYNKPFPGVYQPRHGHSLARPGFVWAVQYVHHAHLYTPWFPALCPCSTSWNTDHPSLLPHHHPVQVLPGLLQAPALPQLQAQVPPPPQV